MSCLSGLGVICLVCLVWGLYVLSVCLGVICLVCLGCLSSFLLLTELVCYMHMYFHVYMYVCLCAINLASLVASVLVGGRQCCYCCVLEQFEQSL